MTPAARSLTAAIMNTALAHNCIGSPGPAIVCEYNGLVSRLDLRAHPTGRYKADRVVRFMPVFLDEPDAVAELVNLHHHLRTLIDAHARRRAVLPFEEAHT